ncbi:IS21-like element helper ATPase IstB [Acidithiobacillus sp. IBUN Pt1247-S3]|uniref:IS21-like element helper ATPase IstB n=1 Tax=Acidithiobacillus sp. IBUN Pt1247-S3 TaxID=3166642 RepID=UPI0034E56786
MQPQELRHTLSTLRLSGILDSLEARNRQAIDGQLAYTEFLALLLQDEVARRDQRKFDTRIRQAHFQSHKTLEDFAFDRLPGVNRALVHDLATGHYLQERAPVLIVGPCGTGKSHLAQALGHCAIRQGVDVLFITQNALLGSLHAARATGSYARRFRQLATVSLLIIDDFGLKPLHRPHDEDFHDLIAERYERVTTLLTSNLDLSEWGEVFPANRMLGVATIDRLRHGAYRLILEGESYREPRPLPGMPQNSPKIAGCERGQNRPSLDPFESPF